MRRLLFILVLISWKIGFSQCQISIVPNKASYCAGEAVTIRVLNADGSSTYQIKVGSQTVNDTFGVFYMAGGVSTRDYDVIVNQTKGGITLPCNFPYPKLHVIQSPDPSLGEVNNFKYCTGTNQPVDVKINNTSSTSGTNTNYTIDWGDGGPVTNTATFSAQITHTYNPGRYVIHYTVSGVGTPPCSTVSRDYVLIIGQSPRIDATFAQGLFCAPTKYCFNLNLDSMSSNFASTTYSLIVNNQTVSSYTQQNLQSNLCANFSTGSCQVRCNGFNKYSVIFRAKNECGTTDASTCVPVKDSITAVIDGKDTVCINDNTSYVNSGLGKIYVDQGNCDKPPVTWDISPATGFNVTNGAPYNNNQQTTKDFQVTFTQYGTYILKMHVFGSCNDDDTTFKITVVDPVKADATFIPPNCIPPIGYVDVPFTNTSTGTIQTYTWSVNPSTGTSFQVGNANTKDVTIRFTKSGNYVVSLTVHGSCNDDTWTGNVPIKGTPNIDTSKIPPGCSAPYTFNPSAYFTFDNGGDAGATYQWSFPGGNPISSTLQDPGNVTYAAPGFYNITLKVTNMCDDSSLTQQVTVFNNAKPSAGGDKIVCLSSPPITLVANPPGGVWRGQGIIDSVNGKFDPSKVLAGSYAIIYVLNPTSACPTYDTINIRVVEIVGLTAGPDQTVCKSTGTLTLTGDPAFPGGSWTGTGVTSSSGTFDPTGLPPGQYQVGYIYGDSTGACTDTAYKRVTIFDSVHVVVPAPTMCAGQPFDFGSITGNMTSAVWKWGDGTPDAIIVNPSHVYASPGNYIITLYAETGDRCRDTIKIPVTVIKNPPLSFIINPDSSCTGNNILFTFPPGHDTATNYLWDFGISTVQSNTPDPQTFSFPKPILKDTNYIVTLRADYFCGPSFFSDTVKVKANPKADFGVQPTGCSPFTPTLANTSYGSPTNYFWNFGNGQTTTTANPNAPTYTNMTRRDSVFTISLTVFNACGRDSIKKNITVKANDVHAQFFSGVNQGCQPLDVDFFSISSPGAQIIWDFGDGTTSYADNVVHTYDTAGTFRVKLLALGSCGRDSAFETVNIFPTPKVNFDVINPCAGQAAQFINKSTNGNSNLWDFGDGTQSTTPNPFHTYATVGSYTVKLIVANSRPCVDSLEKQVAVYQPPASAFDVITPAVCQQEPTIFVNNSTNANSYIWYFGDNLTSTEGAPHYVYQNPGTYNVSLVAINGPCRDSSFKISAAQVYPKPLAEFLYDLSAQHGFHDPVVFTNTTLNGVNYHWTFGDGDTSAEKDPTHQYAGEGPYRVTLYVVSAHDCKDTVSHALGVDYSGTLYVPNVFSPEVGEGETAIFKPKGLSLKEYHLEIFSTYGQLLWETDKLENNSPVEGWDGRYKGTLLPQDVYVWKIRAIFTDGKAWEGMKDPKSGKKTVMGSVLLLR